MRQLYSSTGLRQILVEHLSLSHSFFLIYAEDDRNNRRFNMFADLLLTGIRAELAYLKGR